jgi:2-polyprenyl-3-methyl-5-hydroxy-6-metoxy-1,4-benzoquinol methylase
MTKIIRANQIKFNYENLKKQWKELLSKYYLPSGELDSSYTKIISCPHCNRNIFLNEFCLNGFWHKTCSNCNVVYVSPRLSDACIEELYSSSYYNEVYATSMLPAFEVRKNTIGIGKYNQVIKLLDAPLMGKRVLDIGAGIGEVSDVFQDKGWEVHSTEMNELAIKWLNTRGFSEVFHGDFYSYTSDYKYDVIMAWGVIEHVLDPRKFLQKVFHYLATGGVFISEVPQR